MLYHTFQKLKKQRDELKRYQKRINGVLEKDRVVAKKLLQEGKKEYVFKFKINFIVSHNRQLFCDSTISGFPLCRCVVFD